MKRTKRCDKKTSNTFGGVKRVTLGHFCLKGAFPFYILSFLQNTVNNGGGGEGVGDNIGPKKSLIRERFFWSLEDVGVYLFLKKPCNIHVSRIYYYAVSSMSSFFYGQ
jgi:hypothetical protein